MSNRTILGGRYPQRVRRFYGAADGLLSDCALCVAADDKQVYIGTDQGLDVLCGGKVTASLACGRVNKLRLFGGAVWFAADNRLCRIAGDEVTTAHTFDAPITGLDGDETLYITTESALWKLTEDGVVCVSGTELPAQGVAAAGSRVVSFSGRSLMLLKGKRTHWRCIFPEHTEMPEMQIHACSIERETGFVWLATDRGVVLYDDGRGWYDSGVIDTLPAEEAFDLCFLADGTVAVATAAGLVLIEEGGKHYLPAERWTPAQKINAVAACGSDVFAATDRGVSCISQKEMTLEEKAEAFFRTSEDFFFRAPGFHTRVGGLQGNDLAGGHVVITDNDGLWTQVYLAALCFAYAVTGREDYRAAARRYKEGMLLLTRVSGIPGFTARAVRFPHEPGFGKGTGRDGDEWHPSPDGSCEWLGETSSDEMTGHFFGFSIYYDLCADENEKAEIRAAVCGIVDHILANGYRLCDIDGLPTTWACWAPDELNEKNMWLWEKCLNSLQMLAFLDVAYHMTGDEKYCAEFRHLAFEKHYLLNAAHEKKADGRVTHIDDQLGFLNLATILRLETDPAIRRYLLMGMRAHWDYERDEGNPLWNLIYGAFTSGESDLDLTLQTLRDFPTDLVSCDLHNSARKDLEYDETPLAWGGERQMKTALRWDARQLTSYSSNPYRVDATARGNAMSPYIFLLPYWFGRYYGLIDEG
ncbi:MAG: hypothetical protein IK080_00325 [Clostridia bacterium]|nr:hypothetical protein [Clostridia bacterium]